MPLSIVIPAFDEEDRIGSTLDAASRFLAEAGITAEVLVVDDGSTDSTVARVEERIERICRDLGLVSD